jgi:hypothetical protein
MHQVENSFDQIPTTTDTNMLSDDEDEATREADQCLEYSLTMASQQDSLDCSFYKGSDFKAWRLQVFLERLTQFMCLDDEKQRSQCASAAIARYMKRHLG